MLIYPDYYKSFHCIADKCKHNCCIGWEIDIDDETFSYYSTLKGKIGDQLSQNIDKSGIPHFILDKNDRCPFLNDKNLCDIMINLGENKVCEVCSQHPRFYNDFEHHTECGIGLCCEEAARLILSKKDITHFIYEGNEKITDKYIELRNNIISLLQERDKSISYRIGKVFSYFGIIDFDVEISYWLKYLLSLERLDNRWTDILTECVSNMSRIDYLSFDRFMKNREIEYEQFCIYLVFRHLATAQSDNDFIARIRFVKLAYTLLYTLGACKYTLTGDLAFDEQTDLARMFSSEIEYSEENIALLLEKLC